MMATLVGGCAAGMWVLVAAFMVWDSVFQLCTLLLAFWIAAAMALTLPSTLKPLCWLVLDEDDRGDAWDATADCGTEIGHSPLAVAWDCSVDSNSQAVGAGVCAGRLCDAACWAGSDSHAPAAGGGGPGCGCGCAAVIIAVSEPGCGAGACVWSSAWRWAAGLGSRGGCGDVWGVALE